MVMRGKLLVYFFGQVSNGTYEDYKNRGRVFMLFYVRGGTGWLRMRICRGGYRLKVVWYGRAFDGTCEDYEK